MDPKNKRPKKSAEYRCEKSKISRLRTKIQVLTHYCNGTPICQCCGETNLMFLTLDHINNNGAAHRKEAGVSNAFRRWLIKNNFPEGLQVLCFNCNCGRAANGGICPHIKINIPDLTYKWPQRYNDQFSDLPVSNQRKYELRCKYRKKLLVQKS